MARRWRRGGGSRFGRTPKRVSRRVGGWEREWDRRMREMQEWEVRSSFLLVFLFAGSFRAAILAMVREVSAVVR